MIVPNAASLRIRRAAFICTSISSTPFSTSSADRRRPSGHTACGTLSTGRPSAMSCLWWEQRAFL